MPSMFSLLVACAWLLAGIGASRRAVQVGTPNASTRLPPVEEIASKAEDKAQDFAEKAGQMQARVEKQQQETKATLEQHKEAYEQQLRVQRSGLSALEDANMALQHKIHVMGNVKHALESETASIKLENDAMHAVLGSFQSKMVTAKDFIDESLRMTDDSGAPELKALEPEVPAVTLDRFLKEMPSVGMLQMNVGRVDLTGSPEDDLVQALSQTLEDLALAEHDGEAELKAQFDKAFEQGEQRRRNLTAAQESLNATSYGLLSHLSALQNAKTHLFRTHVRLRNRIEAIQVFAQNLDSMIGQQGEAFGMKPFEEMETQRRPVDAEKKAEGNARDGWANAPQAHDNSTGKSGGDDEPMMLKITTTVPSSDETPARKESRATKHRDFTKIDMGVDAGNVAAMLNDTNPVQTAAEEITSSEEQPGSLLNLKTKKWMGTSPQKVEDTRAPPAAEFVRVASELSAHVGETDPNSSI